MFSNATNTTNLESLQYQRQNKMKTLLLSLLSIFLLSLNGCQKDIVKTELVGKWEWVSTTGGIAGIHQTPQTLGYTYTVVYTKDGKYEKYDQNNQLVLTYPFKIIKDVSIFDNKEHTMIQLNNTMNYSFEIKKDSLFLSQEVYDGFNEVFVRK